MSDPLVIWFFVLIGLFAAALILENFMLTGGLDRIIDRRWNREAAEEQVKLIELKRQARHIEVDIAVLRDQLNGRLSSQAEITAAHAQVDRLYDAEIANERAMTPQQRYARGCAALLNHIARN